MKKKQEPEAEPIEQPGVDQAAEIERLTLERDDYLDKWKRTQADYANLRRRTAADIEAAVRRSQQGLLEGLLLAIDHLDLALAAPAKTPEAQALRKGVELTRDQMLNRLAHEGVQPITIEQAFDPRLHEAVVTVEDTGAEPGTIVAVVRPGYTWGDVVLRPAHVQVAGARKSDAAGDVEAG
jgi:molecular chaperone GrpE